ncbi:hypothetical protein HFO97_17190 [Rhizobium leguminosarum]|uniref:hypothetical protein n=1 Tax=Rhizobium leguminosarum TaxID=384 RepID=UPI001C9473C3|nr:hypothetical protein [Rhizobium leguminosarum]MBY5361659.1 hypothetical protein [Rhizobium leguminosarum]
MSLSSQIAGVVHGRVVEAAVAVLQLQSFHSEIRLRQDTSDDLAGLATLPQCLGKGAPPT